MVSLLVLVSSLIPSYIEDTLMIQYKISKCSQLSPAVTEATNTKQQHTTAEPEGLDHTYIILDREFGFTCSDFKECQTATFLIRRLMKLKMR